MPSPQSLPVQALEEQAIHHLDRVLDAAPGALVAPLALVGLAGFDELLDLLQGVPQQQLRRLAQTYHQHLLVRLRDDAMQARTQPAEWMIDRIQVCDMLPDYAGELDPDLLATLREQLLHALAQVLPATVSLQVTSPHAMLMMLARMENVTPAEVLVALCRHHGYHEALRLLNSPRLQDASRELAQALSTMQMGLTMAVLAWAELHELDLPAAARQLAQMEATPRHDELYSPAVARRVDVLKETLSDSLLIEEALARMADNYRRLAVT